MFIACRCIEHHGKSGLTKRVKESTVDMAEAQQMVRGMWAEQRYAGRGKEGQIGVDQLQTRISQAQLPK